MDKLLVEIPQGKLLGDWSTSDLNGTKYCSFLGIPYAKPPVGNLRFMPPEPPDNWSGIRNAKKPGNHCLHNMSWNLNSLAVGSEDCLYLNIYTPEAPCDIQKPKAVIFVIHCGGNSWGSADPNYFAGPDFIIHHDVIMVACNYRLHVFGFLNLDLPNCAGNSGLKDQVMAMRWTKQNIKYFGGDPDNITLYGNSSGASTIHLHMISPLSKGLFNKAVLQGGYALCGIWGYQDNHAERAQQLAEKLEFKVNHTKRFLRFLKQTSATDIVQAFMKMLEDFKKKVLPRPYNSLFMPSIESFDDGAFLSRSPRELLYTNEPIPLLWSITESEGLHALIVKPWQSTLREILETNLWMYKMSSETLDEVVERVKSFYFGKSDIHLTTIPQLINLYTDIWYAEWNNVLNFQTILPGAAPLYLYLFTFIGELSFQEMNFNKNVDRGTKGACHGDDSPYFIYYKIFHKLFSKEPPFPEKELKVIHNMCTMITNFSKTGNPNGGLTEELDWKPYHPDDPEYLQFGEELEIKKGIIFENRALFWREITDFIKSKEKLELENKMKNLKIEPNMNS